MVGRVECVVPRKSMPGRRHQRLDFSEVLYKPREAKLTSPRCLEGQTHDIDRVLDREIIERARPALYEMKPVVLATSLRNKDRAFGAMLSGEVARRFGGDGLPDDSITINAVGTAGQSFGAFLARGVTLHLEGDANDYVGKGLSGGVVALTPPSASPFKHEEQVIAGNTVLYGATSGKAFFNGRVGERFAVRNSGATAVVEGVGDHGCEYMTGGLVLVLGPVGRNFGAGMSGGVVYVLDESGELESRCHPELVGDLEAAGEADLAKVRSLLEEHFARTASPKARDLLTRFDAVSKMFRRILPREYKRALEERRQRGQVDIPVGAPAAEGAVGAEAAVAGVTDLAAERSKRVAHG
jgi:glutamate synthase (NADPH/NADH) large chain